MAADDFTWYVVPADEGWLVTERTRGGRKVFPTKSLAVAIASELARAAAPARVQVRRTDGSIERELRFGADGSVDAVVSGRASHAMPKPGVRRVGGVRPVYARRMSRTPADAPSSKRMRRSTRVLLVDDEPLVRSSFCRLLASHGWDVVLAADCEEVDRTVATEAVHAAVIDLTLPGSMELAERLLEEGRASRVVFFTGREPEGGREHSAAFGPVVRKGSPQILLDALRPGA